MSRVRGLAPGFDQIARFGEPEEKCSFRHSSRSLRLKLIWTRPERKVVNRRMRIRLQSTSGKCFLRAVLRHGPGTVIVAAKQAGPNDAGILVGQRHRRYVRSAP
jgi:hypothetical protein